MASPANLQSVESVEASLLDRYRSIRRQTRALTAGLSEEDCLVQSMPDASPAKWHLAHTTWFFETFVLPHADPSYRVFDADYNYLFNSYYNTVGSMHPRPQRGLLTRPSLASIHDYRGHVDESMESMLSGGDGHDLGPLRGVIELGLHHEQQHQELILTDIKNAFAANPTLPAYVDDEVLQQDSEPSAGGWMDRPESIAWIGHSGTGFAFDNEGPQHRQFVEAYRISTLPVTIAEYLAFIADGGYRRAELWLSDGWSLLAETGWQAPLYWFERGGEWYSYTLRGPRPLSPAEPVAHVSYYEADAFARWAGARLPTEAEWELVAAELAVEGNFVESARYHPSPLGTASVGPCEFFGNVWEWTRSPYAPYPGYVPPAGALGEYNGKFMSNQMVLRGGSCATPRSHMRATYRNFFPPDARWQFAGFRLARDA